jgi:hypothetical protein
VRNGVRHWLGAGTGVLVTLLFATGAIVLSRSGGGYVATGVGVGLLILIGVLLGSRISPVASLLCGLILLAAGALSFTPWLWRDLVPEHYYEAFRALFEVYSWPVGIVLVTASIFPGRWRAATRPQPPAEEVKEELPEPPPLPKRIPPRY